MKRLLFLLITVFFFSKSLLASYNSEFNTRYEFTNKLSSYSLCSEDIWYNQFNFDGNKIFSVALCKEIINTGFNSNLIHYYRNSDCPNGYKEISNGSFIIDDNSKFTACGHASKIIFDQNINNKSRVRFYSTKCPKNFISVINVSIKEKNEFNGCVKREF